MNDESKSVTMWCSRYALSDGVAKKFRGDIGESGDYFHPNNWMATSWRIGIDAHHTEAEANKAAEKNRQRKIKSLEKQLAKLRALSFEEAGL